MSTAGWAGPDQALTGDDRKHAEQLAGGAVSITVSSADGHTPLGSLAGQVGPDGARTPANDLGRTNTALSFTTATGQLVGMRLVGGDLYLAADLTQIESLAADGGSPLDISSAVQGAPPAVTRLVGDLRAGQWVKLPLGPYLSQLSQLGGRLGLPTPSAAPDGMALLRQLRATVAPAVTVTDGADGTITAEVQVRKALQAALPVLQAQGAVSGLAGGIGGLGGVDPATALDGLSDATVTATLDLSGGHLPSVRLPLAGLASLDPSTTPATVKALDDSALVVDVNDQAEPVSAPSDVSPVDVSALLQQMLAPLLGQLGAAAGLGGVAAS